MTSRRRPTPLHRLHAWFALAILLLGALAPSISAAVGPMRGNTAWQEICRSPASQADTPDTALDALLMGHCALCPLHAADLALPPVAPPLTLRQDLRFAMPERFYSAPGTAHAWRAAPARAPPRSA